jgi:hypothetical protein
VPWTADDPAEIIVHCRWDELKGTFKRSVKEAARGTEKYDRAKTKFDQDAADELVAECVRESSIDRIVDCLMACTMPVRIVTPHPEYDPSNPGANPFDITNALPFAYQAYLATELGCDIEHDIIEAARPGRTKLTRLERFLWQPRFSGPVHPETAYIIADDVCTTAGTLAALRSHIVGNGGTVIGVTTLACQSGEHLRFPIVESTRNVLLSKYGEQLPDLWKEEIGHDIACLTENEGSYLADAVPEQDGPERVLQRLRDRLAETKSKGGK